MEAHRALNAKTEVQLLDGPPDWSLITALNIGLASLLIILIIMVGCASINGPATWTFEVKPTQHFVQPHQRAYWRVYFSTFKEDYYCPEFTFDFGGGHVSKWSEDCPPFTWWPYQYEKTIPVVYDNPGKASLTVTIHKPGKSDIIRVGYITIVGDTGQEEMDGQSPW